MSWIEKLLPPRIKPGGARKTVPEGVWTKCPGCEAVLYSAELERSLQVCPKCGHHLVIDEAGAGLVVQCPKCGHDAKVPNPAESKPGPSAQPATDSRQHTQKTVALPWTPPPPGPSVPPKK